MADFTISGALDPRQLLEGLKQFEQQVTVTAAKAGQGLTVEFGKKVSAELPSILSKALRGAEGDAGKSGTAIGTSLSGAISKQVSTAIPSSLQKALSGSGGNASSIGSKIGQSLGQSVSSGLGSTIPSAVSKALSGSGEGAQREGQKIGRGLGTAAGSSINGTIPSALSKALSGADAPARSTGARLGTELGNSLGRGASGTVPDALRKALAAGDSIVTSSGLKIGRSAGDSIGRGIDQNKALFASVIAQAQKAAQQVGITFNTVKLRFETAKGEIIPQKELDKLRALSPSLDAACAKLSGFTGATAQGSDGLHRLGSAFTNVSDRGGLMQAAITGISFSLANTFTNAIGSAVGALKGMLGEFIAVDSELRLAATAAEETGGYDKLRAVVDQVGIEASGTNLEVAKLATSLVRAGYTVDEVAQALPGVVRGAEATGTSFETMGSITGATLRGFGLNVDQTSRVVDVLVKTANASNASVEGLGETFKYAAPVANALGISLEDLAATAGLMANAGIDASVAGTGLRFGLTRLQKAASGASGESLNLTKGQEKLTSAMRLLGSEVTKADGTLRPLDQVFIAMKRSLEKLGPATRIELVSAIFGDEAGSKFLALLNQSDEAILKMTETTRNAKGSTDVARAGMQSFGLAVKQLTGGISTLATSVGEVIAMALTPFVNAANGVIQVLVQIPAPIRTLSAALALLAGTYATAKVAAIAFGRALKTDMVSDAIRQVQALTRLLRIEFKKDIAAAFASWRQFQSAINTNSTNAAVAGLAQMAQGLKNLRAADVAAGFAKLFGSIGQGAGGATRALNNLVTAGVLKLQYSLGNTAIGLSQLGSWLARTADASRLAEKGMKPVDAALKGLASGAAAPQGPLKGLTLLIQQGFTAGARIAANTATNLSRVFGELASGNVIGAAKVGIQGLIAALGPAAPLMGAAALAVAGVAAAVVTYNSVMGESRQVTASVGPIVDDFGKKLKGAGIEFENFGRQGGPMAELGGKLGKSFNWASEGLRSFAEWAGQLPLIGGLAGLAVKGLGVALDNMPVAKVVQGIGLIVENWKRMHAEAKQNQAIVEAKDQMDQYETQVQAAANSASQFTARLKNMGVVAPAAIKPLTDEFNANRQALSNSVSASSNLAAQFRLLADVAKKNNQPELVKHYENMARWADANVKLSTQQLQALEAEATKRGLVKKKLEEQADAGARLVERMNALNEVLSRQSGQLEGMQMQVSLSRALGELEQSRFNVIKSRAQFELSTAQDILNKDLEQLKERGVGEGVLKKIREQGEKEIGALKRQLEEQEMAALEARYRALVNQQALEEKMLALSQQKATSEAKLAALQAEVELNKAILAMKEAQKKGDDAAFQSAVAEVSMRRQAVTLQQDKVTLLGQLQPMERQIAQATAETARNGLIAEGAAKGWDVSLQGVTRSAVAADPVMAAVAAKTALAAQGTQQMAQSTTQATAKMGGLAVEATRAADGTIVIKQKMGEAGVAAGTMANNAGTAAGAIEALRQRVQGVTEGTVVAGQNMGQLEVKARRAADGTIVITQELNKAASGASTVNQNMGGLMQSAARVADSSGSLAKSLGSAAGPADSMAQAISSGADASGTLASGLGEAGQKVKPADQTAKSVAQSLSSSASSAAKFAGTNFNGNLSAASGSAGGLAKAMASAAGSAQTFYNWLAKASGLPNSRATGGPVEAGQTYRVNELGQEAFLSGGKLSLIDRPRNGLWRAPVQGVVIPAGVTETLKAKGVFTPGGQGQATPKVQAMVRSGADERRDQAAVLAQQAIAIGKLQQSVDRLVEKDWSVHVRVRPDSGAAHLNAWNGLR